MREQISSGSIQRERDHLRQYEYLVLTVNKGESVKEARRALAEHAEYGKWDLIRTRFYMGGSRKYWMRRKVLRVEATV
ncbi:DUF5703 family protein [Arthrobacter crystallopoietes]|jgi:hypothetical protein|uniref:DUF5703 family protein n=1 Tax=Crystallibacter crystallopoietes TaxID=37928 RepID=UPI0011112B67|nr:DUF5703 family protein [Arthrobacter crystallopoietes]QTG80147.1 hypothetical protein J5251_14850 [Arthrobacter crystallopoietes]